MSQCFHFNNGTLPETPSLSEQYYVYVLIFLCYVCIFRKYSVYVSTVCIVCILIVPTQVSRTRRRSTVATSIPWSPRASGILSGAAWATWSRRARSTGPTPRFELAVRRTPAWSMTSPRPIGTRTVPCATTSGCSICSVTRRCWGPSSTEISIRPHLLFCSIYRVSEFNFRQSNKLKGWKINR